MTPRNALNELLTQHATLREMMSVCEGLADAIDVGGGDPARLAREVAKLRIAFAAHNEFEEQILRPVLLEADAFGEVRIERMVSEHVDEHRSMRARLENGSPATAALRETLHDLMAHLDAEERYFLSSKVLRDDLITLEGAG